MTWDYFGFSQKAGGEAAIKEKNAALNNPADISVIVIYFLVVLGVGIWVSYLLFPSTIPLVHLICE